MEFDINIPEREYREFEEHGEIWLQHKLKNKLNIIFDVGCNLGHWTTMAKYFNPNAEVHMFELSPTTYKNMINLGNIQKNVYPNGFGLSDENVLLPFEDNTYSPMSSAIIKNNKNISNGIVLKGDDYVNSRKIDHIDFLKIDVEGWEGKVFNGFKNTISSGKVKIIQFEYAYICILSRWLLVDSYKFLEPYGYKLGKLKNGRIEFHDYGLTDETFNGPEYIAVHENHWDLFKNE